jgi:hypothetical protein
MLSGQIRAIQYCDFEKIDRPKSRCGQNVSQKVSKMSIKMAKWRNWPLNYPHRLISYGPNRWSFTERCLGSAGIFKGDVIGILAAVVRLESMRRSSSCI